MPNTSEDASLLLSAAKRGDKDALEALLVAHHQQVYRFGLRMCGNPEDAADVLQNTLLAAAQNLPEFRGDASLSTWLHTIARRFCSRRNRTEKRAARMVALDDLVEGSLEDVPEPTRTPEEVLADRELHLALEAAIESLAPELREALVLRDVQGLSGEETSQVLGVSIESVKSRLHRARIAVRKSLKPDFRPHAKSRSDSDCPDIEELFSRHLEGEIPPAICAQMEKHVARCPKCSDACSELRSTLALCETALRHEPVPDEVSAIVRKTLASRDVR